MGWSSIEKQREYMARYQAKHGDTLRAQAREPWPGYHEWLRKEREHDHGDQWCGIHGSNRRLGCPGCSYHWADEPFDLEGCEAAWDERRRVLGE